MSFAVLRSDHESEQAVTGNTKTRNTLSTKGRTKVTVSQQSDSLKVSA